MQNMLSSKKLETKDEIVDLVSKSNNAIDLSDRLLQTSFNALYIDNVIGYEDIKNIIIALTSVSLSLAIIFGQHMQVVSMLKIAKDNKLQNTGLIASATTSVKGASVSANVELLVEREKISRVCPIISYYEEATHIIFTGVINNKNVIAFADKCHVEIINQQNIETLGMHGNHLQCVELTLDKCHCSIISDGNRFLTNKILPFYAHLYWSIAWTSMLHRVISFIKSTTSEYKFYHYERMQTLINIDLINCSLITRIEQYHSASFENNLIEDLATHVQLNSIKIIISENVTNGMKIVMEILGFQKAYVVSEKNKWLQQAFLDLQSAPLMFNNADLNEINIKTLELIYKFKANRHE